MHDALLTLMEKTLNVTGNLVVFVFLFQSLLVALLRSCLLGKNKCIRAPRRSFKSSV